MNVMRWMLAVPLAAAFISGPAHAEGQYLAWDDCGPHGAQARSWACGSNEGRQVLVGSIVAPIDLPRFYGADFSLSVVLDDVMHAPPWWDLTSGTGCREGAASLDADFSGAPSGGTACFDVFGGRSFGGIYAVPSTGRTVRFYGFMVSEVEHPLAAGVETYLFRLVLDHRRTVGPDACAGCTLGACLWFDFTTLYETGGTSGFALWGFSTFAYWNSQMPRCSTPARRPTWGQIKSRYR